MKPLRSQLKKYRTLLIVLLIILVCLIVLLIIQTARKSNVDTLTLETIQSRNVIKKVSADGNVEGVDSRVVYFNPSQRVTELRVSIGDQVNQDDVLAVLTSNDGRNTNTEVKAPISGIVTESNYKQNDIVSAANSAGMTIVDKSSYQIEMLVNENDIVDVKSGQSAVITYPALSLDNTYKASVVSVYPNASASTAAVNYKVIVKPEEIPDNLKLGMSTNVVITVAEVDNVLSVPESYLIEKDNKVYLKFLTWDDEAKTKYTLTEKEISIGLRTDEYVEVKSGAASGDQVVEPNFQPKKLSIFGN